MLLFLNLFLSRADYYKEKPIFRIFEHSITHNQGLVFEGDIKVDRNIIGVNVQYRLMDSTGTVVLSKTFMDQSFSKNKSKHFIWNLTHDQIPEDDTIRLAIGIFNKEWTQYLAWDNGVLKFQSKRGVASDSDHTDVPMPTYVVPKKKEGLVFSDEFEPSETGALNSEVWGYNTDYQPEGESQCYTKDRRENVRIEARKMEGAANGYLVVELKKEDYECGVHNVKQKKYQYTSGYIRTQKSHWGELTKQFGYGRYEIRAKLPRAFNGTWVSFWLKGVSEAAPWPDRGRINILEYVGHLPNRVHSVLHKNNEISPWPTESKESTAMGHFLDFKEPADSRFRVYTMIWTPDEIRFEVDGVPVDNRTINYHGKKEKKDSIKKSEVFTDDPRSWPFDFRIPDLRYSLMINFALGGSWGSQQGIDDTAFADGSEPIELLIDYIRVYKLEN